MFSQCPRIWAQWKTPGHIPGEGLRESFLEKKPPELGPGPGQEELGYEGEQCSTHFEYKTAQETLKALLSTSCRCTERHSWLLRESASGQMVQESRLDG